MSVRGMLMWAVVRPPFALLNGAWELSEAAMVNAEVRSIRTAMMARCGIAVGLGRTAQYPDTERHRRSQRISVVLVLKRYKSVATKVR